MIIRSFIRTTASVLGLGLILGIHMPLLAGNDIMGEIQFVGASKVRRLQGFG